MFHHAVMSQVHVIIIDRDAVNQFPKDCSNESIDIHMLEGLYMGLNMPACTFRKLSKALPCV